MIDSKNLPLILGVITIMISIIGFVKNLNMSFVQRIYSTFGFINEEKKNDTNKGILCLQLFYLYYTF